MDIEYIQMLDFPDSMWLESLEGNHHFNIFQWTFEGLWGLKKSQAFSCYPYAWNPCRTLLQSPPQPWTLPSPWGLSESFGSDKSRGIGWQPCNTINIQVACYEKKISESISQAKSFNGSICIVWGAPSLFSQAMSIWKRKNTESDSPDLGRDLTWLPRFSGNQ